MPLCVLSLPEVNLPRGQEMILTWENKTEATLHHTKLEYIKILEDASYNIHYQIKWHVEEKTSQPLCLTLYKVTDKYLLDKFDQHVTVHTGSPITVNKKISKSFKVNERICIGAKNLSIYTFTLLEGTFSLSSS